MGLIAESNLYAPQGSDYESDFLKTIDTRGADPVSYTHLSYELYAIHIRNRKQRGQERSYPG